MSVDRRHTLFDGLSIAWEREGGERERIYPVNQGPYTRPIAIFNVCVCVSVCVADGAV